MVIHVWWEWSNNHYKFCILHRNIKCCRLILFIWDQDLRFLLWFYSELLGKLEARLLAVLAWSENTPLLEHTTAVIALFRVQRLLLLGEYGVKNNGGPQRSWGHVSTPSILVHRAEPAYWEEHSAPALCIVQTAHPCQQDHYQGSLWLPETIFPIYLLRWRGSVLPTT